jgi:hypothetical protein
VLAALSDCHLIAVSRIGLGALDYVREQGRDVKIYQGFVEDLLAEESAKELTHDGGE